MSIVYCIQEPLAKGPDGIWQRSMNLDPAEAFGELRFILPRNRRLRNPLTKLNEIVDELRSGLTEFRPDDYLLPTGNPLLITIAGAIVFGLTDGYIPILVWQPNVGDDAAPARAQSALNAIASRPNGVTFRELLAYGRILKNVLGKAGFTIWRDAVIPAFPANGSSAVWNGLDPDGTLAALYRDARRVGWRDPTGAYTAIDVNLTGLKPAMPTFDTTEFEDFSRS